MPTIPNTSTTTPEPPSTGRSRIVLTAWAALGVLALAVVVGLVALWPDGEVTSSRPESQLPDTERAEVVDTARTECQVPSADACLEVTVKLLSGPDTGDEVTFIAGDADDESAAEVGDVLRVVKSDVPEGSEIGGVEVPPYSMSDFERRAPLYWLAGIFALIVLVAGRLHGLRALAGLAGSMAIVVWFIVPALVQGDHPLLVALVGALAVMLLTIPLAHGLGTITVAASLGTTLSLVLTMALAWTFTQLAHLTGYGGGDEVAYLSAYLDNLSVQGLLLAGIVISALGVLDDVTVSQASTVLALRRAAPERSFGWLLRESLVVGRDHVTATVNTLVLAYAGASLPILLVFAIGDIAAGDAFNGEAVASQVVAALVGSIGLIAAMPITTTIAALLATRMRGDELAEATAHAHAHTH
jgi:uncharacterized membrane protein